MKTPSLAKLAPGTRVEGALLPEPVEVIAIVPMGESIKLIARGLDTNQAHQPILDAAQVAQLKIAPKDPPFDGDAVKFKLGIEAHRLALAYEHDPYLALSIARIDPLPHQLEAVYEYFSKLPRIRFLLADDPGGGKTSAQGLGAHLEKLTDVVEVKGDKARLLALSERAKHLFGKEDLAPDAPKQKKANTSEKQWGLFAEIEAAEKQGLVGAGGVPKVGETTLDKVHQSMILFGAGRSEALKRFIVEEGVGKDGRYRKLAQSLSALYPSGAEEKRWVDGVLARKKGLGF